MSWILKFMQNFSVANIAKDDRELNLHFEVETRLICLFDGAAVNVYKLFISI